MSSGDKYFYSILLAIIVALFGLWYMFNPNSPRFEKSDYQVYSDSIHTLAVGNDVTVNGLTRGYVKALIAEDEMVRITVAIDERIEIPVDSKILIRNHGLMGERVVAVLLGNASQLYTPESKIMGASDKGTSGLVLQANTLIGDGKTVVNLFIATLDSLILNEESKRSFETVMYKVKQLAQKSEKIVVKQSNNLTELVEDAEGIFQKVVTLSEGFQQEKVLEDIQALRLQVGENLDKLASLVSIMDRELQKVNNQENSAGKIIYDEEFQKRVQKLKKTLFKGKDVVLAQELNLNIDF